MSYSLSFSIMKLLSFSYNSFYSIFICTVFSVLFFALLKSIVFALLAELLLILWFSGIILLDSKATALTQVQNLLSSDQKFLPANHSLLSETISQQILNVHQMFIHCLLSLKSPFNVWNDYQKMWVELFKGYVLKDLISTNKNVKLNIFSYERNKKCH
mgnify:CR=1 FL=1